MIPMCPLCMHMCMYMHISTCSVFYSISTNMLHAAASAGSVNNFRMVSIRGQNASFSWEVNNVPIGNISHFEIHHRTKDMEYYYTGRGTVRFQVNQTTNSTNGQKLTFSHIVYVRSFGYLLQKIMYLRVMLTDGKMLESVQIYADTRELCLYLVCCQPGFRQLPSRLIYYSDPLHII